MLLRSRLVLSAAFALAACVLHAGYAGAQQKGGANPSGTGRSGTKPSSGGAYGSTSSSGTGDQYGNTQQVATKAKPVNALDHLRKHGGGLDWPIGLCLVEPKQDSQELRQEIDDAVEAMFRQPGGTDTTTKLLKQVSHQVDKLDRMYRARVWDMALTRQQEADVRRFVRRVRDALVAAQESATLYGQSQLYSGTSSPRGGAAR